MQKTVRLASDTEIVKAGKTDRVVLHYTNLDGSSYKPGTPDKIGALAVKLDAETLSTVKAGKAGQVFNIEMTKDGNYWNLTKATVGSSGTFVAQSNTTSTASTVQKKSFDDVGIKVGAAANRAVQYLAATKGTKFTLDDVDMVTYNIVQRQQAVEDNVRAGTSPYDKKPEDSVVTKLVQTELDTDDEFFNQP